MPVYGWLIAVLIGTLDGCSVRAGIGAQTQAHSAL
jgi:hypothetical protein